MLRVNNKDTRTTLNVKRRSGVFFINFEHISYIFLEISLLTFNKLVSTVLHPYW